ncbi:hypothetical protein AB0P05_45650 [Streptomyces flaveolus]|uniref:hypothetical protein n=1 Tax=Streptomyces flaveolus TaxID=67297 RepID=UPI0034293316
MVEGAAGPLLTAGQRRDDLRWRAVEEVGAQLGPADGHTVDEVPDHGFDIAGEPVLEGDEEQGKFHARLAVELDVYAVIAAGGRAGDQGGS